MKDTETIRVWLTAVSRILGINAYEVWLASEPAHKTIVHAPTGAKARAEYFRDASECFEYPRDVWCQLRSKRLPSLQICPQLEQIRESRKVPAEIGMRCEVDGKAGVITGANDGYIMVCFYCVNGGNGKKQSHSVPCHPTWKFKYFDQEGKEIEISHD